MPIYIRAPKQPKKPRATVATVGNSSFYGGGGCGT